MNRHASTIAEAAKCLNFNGIGEANLAFHCAIAGSVAVSINDNHRHA